MLSCALQWQKLEFYYLQSNQLHEKWKNLKLINIPTIKLDCSAETMPGSVFPIAWATAAARVLGKKKKVKQPW